ncbi:hypothetical protein BS78_09G014100 [Paspalum vaginatum]|nr:hypothetical protein BS78_09G014100 [Paspalum vaginatum]
MASSGAGAESIAKRWRELHGENSWEGLLDPLDLDLRNSLISYGELVQAALDGFNKETRSPHAGACLFGYDDLLARSGAAAAGHYKVTRFLYATSEASILPPLPLFLKGSTNFMGFVAVATDEGVAALGRRDVVVVWRGTMMLTENNNNLTFLPTSAEPVLGPPSVADQHLWALVHTGFLKLYTDSNSDSKLSKASARDQVHEEVRKLMELYKEEETSITVIGHSLGSSLATLTAVDLVANRVNAPAAGSSSQPPSPVTAILFASPCVGNDKFRDAFHSFPELRALHVRNNHDPVPDLPMLLPQVGVPLHIDTTLSPYLKDAKKTAHNLQGYLHGVAGAQGSAGGFKLEVDRDPALLNKDTDALKDEYPVPASWWVPHNKCMVKNAQGKWELKDFQQI